MAVAHAVLDDVTLPLFAGFRVDHNLVAVPGFDGGDEAPLAEMADFELARSALRAGARVALRDLDYALRQEQTEAEKIRGHQLLALALPVNRGDAVQNAARLIGKERALPFAGPVEI